MTRRLELLKMALAGTLSAQTPLPVEFPPAIHRLLGIELIAIDEAMCRLRMRTDTQRHANPMGTVHGGILCDLGDSAIGFAHSTLLEEEDSFTSVDLKINFFRPVWNEVITAHAQALHRGRTLSYYECTISNEKDKTVARLTSTVMTLRGDQAKNR